MVPVAAIGMLIEYGILRIGFRRVLRQARLQPTQGPRPQLDRRLLRLSFLVLVLTLVAGMAILLSY